MKDLRRLYKPAVFTAVAFVATLQWGKFNTPSQWIIFGSLTAGAAAFTAEQAINARLRKKNGFQTIQVHLVPARQSWPAVLPGADRANIGSLGLTQPLHSKVLLVTDDARTEQECVEILKSCNRLEHIVARDGNEAVRTAPAGDFDLILIDCSMIGVEACLAAKKFTLLNGRWMRAVVVGLVDDKPNDTDLERWRDAGVDLFICKPVSAADLENLISGADSPGEICLAE